MKTCDNTSVGVLIRDGYDRWLFFERATPPAGIAPPAGHVDDHGTYEDAARAEVHEEVGLTVVDLQQVTGGTRTNRCRRLVGKEGPVHHWRVYRATVTGGLKPSKRETRNARWLTREEIQSLAERTAEHAWGTVSDADFAADPGIEPVWVGWLAEVGLVGMLDADLCAIEQKLTDGALEAAG